MDVKITKEIEGENLIFKIECSKPHQYPFDKPELNLMNMITVFGKKLEVACPDSNLRNDMVSHLKDIKIALFDDIQKQLNEDIKKALSEYQQKITGEVYQWILNVQTEPLKEWINEFRPYRESYYFDNQE